MNDPEELMLPKYEVSAHLEPFVQGSQLLRQAAPFSDCPETRVFATRAEAEQHKQALESEWSGYSFSVSEV